MNRREQILAAALGVILLVGVCSFAFVHMTKWKKDIERREYALSLEKVEADELLKQKDFWMTRSDWLTKKQPVFTKDADANNSIFELVSKTAKESGVTAGPPQMQPLDRSNPGLIAAGVTVSASGELEKILRWLYKLQESPDAFISVRGLTLKPDQEDTNKVLVNELHVLKWYSSATSAAKPETSEGQ